MKFIVRGYTGPEKNSEAVICYAGNDGSEAEAALLLREEGIFRKDIIKYPVPAKTRTFEPIAAEEVPEPVLDLLPDPPAEEVPAAEESAPAEEAPAEEDPGLDLGTSGRKPRGKA